ncbi:MAG: hypothetical protein JHC33_11995 [Ignisphaera sp.]|nr:hypothetical protein [Ignisphaera sp.]
MVDANEQGLHKYLNDIDRVEKIEEKFTKEIGFDLGQILEHSNNIKRVSTNYENDYSLEFDDKEIIMQFIMDNL